MQNLKGTFIVIDGPNASGKSSVAELLSKKLGKQGLDVCLTKEPTETKLGELTKKWEAREKYPLVLACLVAADRYFHIQEEIEPALASGQIVISARYLASSLVLQRLDGLDIEFIQALNSQIIVPDATIILGVSEEVMKRRLTERKTKHHFENLQNACREIEYYKDAVSLLNNLGHKTYEVWSDDRALDDVVNDAYLVLRQKKVL